MTGSGLVRRAGAVRRAARVGSDPCGRLEDRTLFALTVTPYNPASAISALTSGLVQANTGITVTNATYVGANGQGGTYKGFSFNDGKTALSLGNGVLLTNGAATNALGPNNSTGKSTSDNTPGDADLTKLIGGTPTNDANVLTLTFTATAQTKSVAFDFVFGSEEFPEFVGSFNDAFGAYLDGKQISFDSNNKPVTVDNNFFTLNNTSPSDTSSSATKGKTVVSYDLQYDGLTPALASKGTLDTTRTTHTLKLAIADAGDTALDSGVFIANVRGDDTTGGTTTGQPPVAKAGGPYTVTAGGTVKLNGTGSTDPNQSSSSLTYSWDLNGDGVFGETGAAATNGDETTSTPTFKAGTLTAATVKTVSLKVTDNTGLSSTVTTTVTVKAGSGTPTPTPTPTSTVSGVVDKDLTGNGLTADDTRLGGVTVTLYADTDGNGVVSSADTKVASVTSGATGAYSFAKLAAGKYLVAEAVPSGYVRTAPATSDSYAITLTAGLGLTGKSFADFLKPTSSGVSGIIYHVNGKAYTTLSGKTFNGATVTATFTVTNPAGERLSLVSYSATTSTFVAANASKQTVFKSASQFFTPGTYTLSISVPATGHFQVDFVNGAAITTFGPVGSNLFYSQQGRLISSDNE